MKICISAGHATDVRGMVGPAPWGLEEVDEARRVTKRLGELLNEGGVPTQTYWDTVSQTQDENLRRICDWHNSEQRDFDVSVHFNAYDGKAHGCEVFYISQHDLAKRICDAICAASGLTNRGAKDGSHLYVLNHTEKPAVLIEVCFGDHKGDCETYRRAFEPICLAIAESLAGQELGTAPPPAEERPPITPPATPPGPQARATIGIGDKGPDVVHLQQSLGVLIADGDFGGITETWTRVFQGACGVTADGVVGQQTWGEVDKLNERLRVGEPPLTSALTDKIYSMAQQSEIADYAWKDRGIAPPGYVPGVALCFAYTLSMAGGAVGVMSKAAGNPDYDALAWYEEQFRAQGMSNTTPGHTTLRHLFVLIMGLGPRESSGRYFEGRDLSASNVQAETCEAGLFQTSWNIKAGSSTIPPMLEDFWRNPHGFLPTFKEGLSPTSSNLNSYGHTGEDGLRYQWLARYCPLFHVIVTGVGLRTLRKHWGPINERKAEIKRAADSLLQDVQSLVEDEGGMT